MKKFLVYISFLGLLFVSCEKFEPLTTRAGVDKSGGEDQDNASDNGGEGGDKSDIIVVGGGNDDLDVITDPNNDEDYDNEGKNPNSGQNNPN